MPLLVALLAGLVSRATADEAHRYVATLVRTYEVQAEPSLLLPTAVAVARDGSIFVVDGVNDRIVRFDAEGAVLEEIQQVGDERLAQPMAARLDATERLWIVDAGNQRVLVRAPDGSLERTIVFSAEVLQRRPDLTDAALSADGRFLWAVDNNHHQLLRYNLASGELKTLGQRGESLGQFQYPFMLAIAADGDIYLTDVINGRVQALNAEGEPTGTVGTYGVDLGQFFRPNAIAIDAEQRVWISDGVMNVVQAFTPDGRLIDVLRDTEGKPYRFDLPMGLAFDAQGDLYVVELHANRVARLRVITNPAAPPIVVPRRRGGATLGPQARACTVCHLEWMNPLINGQGTALMDVPPNPPEHPGVSRGERCLTCHDGAVADSRRRVWVRHGHRTGIAPPPSVKVPPQLPLADGKIACRTCHSAHGLSEARATLETIVFLRVKSSPSELCVGCHADFAAGPQAGMHPLGEMAIELPADMTHPGAPAGSKGVACLACHTGHGARLEKLLVISPDKNELCLTCHAELSPALFGDATRSKHGRLPTLDLEQRAVADGLKTRVSPGGELLCLTCHVPHRAVTERHLLAFDPAQQDVCAKCHAAQRPMLGTAHDLRTNLPQEKNRLGITAEAGGPCSSCHTAHRYARTAESSAIDPTGRCLTCHAPGGIAKEKQLGSANHSGRATCTDCHNPHDVRYGNYLAAPPSEKCPSCHTDKTSLAGGPHDVKRPSDAWPQASRDANDACLACHRPHGNEQTGLMRAGLASGVDRPDAGCVVCHRDAAPQADTKIGYLHPHRVSEFALQSKLPLATTADGTKRVTCYTCHDPHGGAQAAARFLRTTRDADPQQVCLQCHRERSNIQFIGHAAAPLRAAGFEPTGCRPCHVVHGKPDTVEPHLMWPKSLSVYPGSDKIPVIEHYCRTCHREGGPVAPPAIATHPDVQMFNPETPGSPGYLPLFNERGQEDPQGRISCTTCHLTHGRATAALVPAVLGPLVPREMRARAWHIRTFTAMNVCTTCHGFDALRRFMYFHDAARRGGPITPAPVVNPPTPAPAP